MESSRQIDAGSSPAHQTDAVLAFGPVAPVEPDVRKIAVLRANALGDFLFALPALDALRATYPAAEITLLGRDWHADFLAHRPGPVDRVLAVPPCWPACWQSDPLEDPPELGRFFEAAVAEAFDLAIQIYGGGRQSNPFVRRLGARLTVGLRTPDAVALDRNVPYIYFQPEVLRYLEVVALVGAQPRRLAPALVVTERDLAEAVAVVPESERPLVLLHPGASDPRRRWPAAKFAAAGDALAAAGAQVLVSGVPAERAVVRAVVDAMRAPAHDLCGRLSLCGLTGLLARCQLVIANDTGPLHLAVAVDTPTVGLFWCGNLINAGPFTRTRHRPLLSWRLACPVCGRDCTRDACEHQVSFIADIAVEEVVTAARDVLQR